MIKKKNKAKQAGSCALPTRLKLQEEEQTVFALHNYPWSQPPLWCNTPSLIIVWKGCFFCKSMYIDWTLIFHLRVLSSKRRFMNSVKRRWSEETSWGKCSDVHSITDMWRLWCCVTRNWMVPPSEKHSHAAVGGQGVGGGREDLATKGTQVSLISSILSMPVFPKIGRRLASIGSLIGRIEWWHVNKILRTILYYVF